MPEDEEPAAWQSIAQELLTHKHQSETLAEQRRLFEEFLAKFPTAVSFCACGACNVTRGSVLYQGCPASLPCDN